MSSTPDAIPLASAYMPEALVILAAGPMDVFSDALAYDLMLAVSGSSNAVRIGPNGAAGASSTIAVQNSNVSFAADIVPVAGHSVGTLSAQWSNAFIVNGFFGSLGVSNSLYVDSNLTVECYLFASNVGSCNSPINSISANSININSNFTLNGDLLASNVGSCYVFASNVGSCNSPINSISANSISINSNVSVTGYVFASNVGSCNSPINSISANSISINSNVSVTGYVFASNVGSCNSPINSISANNININSNFTVSGAGSFCNNVLVAGQVSSRNIGLFRNRIINGDMRIAQRSAPSLLNGAGSAFSSVDRFRAAYAGASNLLLEQASLSSNDAPQVSHGMQFSLRASSSNAFSNLSISQNVEGIHFADANWSTPSGGSPVTLSMWQRSTVNSPVTVPVVIFSGDKSSSNVASFQVLQSDVWQHVVCTFSAPTYAFSTEPSVVVNLGGISGSATEVTGVQLEIGTIATPFEQRPFDFELQLCQRWSRTQAGDPILRL
ncbi:hypothetical protein CEUSTIGMA_g13083.t1 [Chlamydomonas eustigma]|uniref:Uncharacterized protein n=1 Tax=Chlamydomonas eustigma TaxID=1157962 RepID=A0A250XRH4_9CHLO|nr:hypothetical protein CEUSTIGMA_g13083.t1 [Chlamydomonas eustigma]|eukprot:GAX85668.1 hypothetical protein CEUSTIGMA_g13083.t1 [Chlamydomonas eustigma]